jgi:hypothetical protein
MSVHNGSRYLREAVESILLQSFRDYEFIVVDDGSTDGSRDILLGYKDPRMRVITKEHTGLAHSLNVGLEQARGEWVARMDADDVAEPHRLECQLGHARASPNLVLLGSDCTLIDAAGHPMGRGRYPDGHAALLNHMERGGSSFPHTSAIFNRRVALEVGGYNQRFLRSQDLDLWFRLSAKGLMGSLPQPLVRVRKHSAAMPAADGGKDSLVYGAAARICHLRRRRGLPDPSRGPEEAWRGFLAQVERGLASSGALKAMQARAILREEAMRRANGKLPWRAQVALVLLRHPALALAALAPYRYRRAVRAMAWGLAEGVSPA